MGFVVVDGGPGRMVCGGAGAPARGGGCVGCGGGLGLRLALLVGALGRVGGDAAVFIGEL